tara:strand:- start:182 stop:1006 length:825 start_codon:yes stop_codon:yes gene_type:complete
MATAFTYTNTGEATLNKDTSNSQYGKYYKRSTTVNSPTTYQPFVFHKGVDNHVTIVINDKSRRTANIDNVTIKAKLIKRSDRSVVVTKNAIVESFADAKVTFKVQPGDIANLDPTLYEFALTSVNNEGEEFLLSPQLNHKGQFTVEVRDGPFPKMPPVVTLSTFTGGAGATDPQFSSATDGSTAKGSPDGLHTVAIYTTNFKGKIYVQGSVESEPGDADYFLIDTNGLTGHEDYSSATSGVRAVNFVHNLMKVRFYFEATADNTGTVDKITIRV